MRKFFIKSSLLITSIILTFGISASSFAAEFTTTSEKVSIQKNEVDDIIDYKNSQTFYKFTEDKGDVYLPFLRIAMDKISVDKEVSKSGMMFSGKSIDVIKNMKGVQTIFARDTVRINSDMEYAAVFADNVIIDSKIDKSMLIFANEVTITNNAQILEDIVIFSPQINMLGNIQGSLIGSAQKLTLSGNITGDLRMELQEINLHENTDISGDIVIKTFNQNFKLNDKFKDAKIEIFEQNSSRKANIINNIKNALFTAIIFTAVYVLTSNVFKSKLYKKLSNNFKTNRLKITITGIVNILLIPIILICLLILSLAMSIIGLPMLVAYGTIIYLSISLSSFIIGIIIIESFIKNKENSMSKNMLITFATYFILAILVKLPYIGSYIALVIVIYSLGLVINMIMNKLSYKKQISNESEKID